jgi:hypothetical protein
LVEKETIYRRFIPAPLLDQFHIDPDLEDSKGRPLLTLRCREGSTDVVLELRYRFDDLDPLLYAHLTDTINGQIHVLLYVVNDPDSPRFDVDRMPDGEPTEFGTSKRNLSAETAALAAGLAPGLVHRGLRILRQSIECFEEFISSLSHDIYFVEPLYYHNAIIFEKYGFSYERGKKWMERIQAGFLPDGDLYNLMEPTSPFRHPSFCCSIRGRSWALHDGILGEPFSGVTMYKQIGEHAGINTYPDSIW